VSIWQQMQGKEASVIEKRVEFGSKEKANN
jgi:hypothetical protein